MAFDHGYLAQLSDFTSILGKFECSIRRKKGKFNAIYGPYKELGNGYNPVIQHVALIFDIEFIRIEMNNICLLQVIIMN